MLTINRLKALKLVLLFALINSSIFIAFTPNGFSLMRISIVSLLLISVFLLIVFFIKKEEQTYSIHPYFKLLFVLLFIWSGFTVFRSVTSNSIDLISLFGHYLMGWAWITPLAIVFGLNIFNWIDIFNFLSRLLLVGVIASILFISVTNADHTVGVVEWVQFFPVLLLTYFYQNKFNRKIVVLATLSFVLLSIFNEQRINAVYLALTLIFVSIEYLKQKNIDVLKKVFFSVFISIFILFMSLEIPNFYNKVTNDKSASADTRTFLFVEMFNDMSEDELLIGRGALGTYYSPYFAMLHKYKVKGGDSATRSVNEVGYLEMILKGGYIMMFLYLFILMPAAYLGIVKSKNSISRMSGYLILIYLLIWSVSYYPVYSAEYLLLWMAVGTAISPQARRITNKELENYINGVYN